MSEVGQGKMTNSYHSLASVSERDEREWWGLAYGPRRKLSLAP